MTTATLHSTPARTLARSLAIAAGALALAFGGAAQAAPGGWHGGGGGGGWHGGGGYHGGGAWHGGGSYYRGGWGWDPLWGVGLGLGLGLAAASPYYYDNGPGVVYVNPPVYYPPAPVYYPPAPVYVQAPPMQPAPVQSTSAEPIFYPRTGQSAAQTEADRQECNRWATTQPKAMADGSVFQRAPFACMDGRGYTPR